MRCSGVVQKVSTKMMLVFEWRPRSLNGRSIACAVVLVLAILVMQCAHGQPGRGEQTPHITGPPGAQTSVFKDCAHCPEMVALLGADVALGRYEVTIGEFRAFAAAVPDVADEARCGRRRRPWWRPWGYSGRSPTERHPVGCVSWNQAQVYLEWLSLETGQQYHLPTSAEWDRGAAGSPMGCFFGIRNEPGACAVGNYAPSDAGLFDMVGNLWEWTNDCWDGDCSRKVLRGASFRSPNSDLNPDARTWARPEFNSTRVGFRVARTLPFSPKMPLPVCAGGVSPRRQRRAATASPRPSSNGPVGFSRREVDVSPRYPTQDPPGTPALGLLTI